MESKATAKYMRIAPRKVRLVADTVKGKRLEWALNALEFTPKRAAEVLKKVINSAKANASEKNIDVDTLRVQNIIVNEGPIRPYRFLPRAHGRATRIRKRVSHITVHLDDQT